MGLGRERELELQSWPAKPGLTPWGMLKPMCPWGEVVFGN